MQESERADGGTERHRAPMGRPPVPPSPASAHRARSPVNRAALQVRFTQPRAETIGISDGERDEEEEDRRARWRARAPQHLQRARGAAAAFAGLLCSQIIAPSHENAAPNLSHSGRTDGMSRVARPLSATLVWCATSSRLLTQLRESPDPLGPWHSSDASNSIGRRREGHSLPVQ